MTDTVLQSFCERCGTGFMLELPPEKPAPSPSVLGRFKRKAPEPYAGADAAAVFPPGEAFAGTSHFCLECRRYNCSDCWNEQEGHCITCRPPGAKAAAAASRAASAAPDAAPAPRVAQTTPTAWPSDDVARAATAGTQAGASKETDRPAAPVPPASSAAPAAPPSPRPADRKAASRATTAAASTGDALPWTSEPDADPWRGVVFSSDDQSPHDRTVESASPASVADDRPSNWPGADHAAAPELQSAALAPTVSDGGATEGSDAALDALASLDETNAHVDAADWARASAAVVGHGTLKSNAPITEPAGTAADDTAVISPVLPTTEAVAGPTDVATEVPVDVAAEVPAHEPVEVVTPPAEEPADVVADEPAGPAEEPVPVAASTDVGADDVATTEGELEVAAALDADVGVHAEPTPAPVADIDDFVETIAEPDVAIEPLPDQRIAAGLVVAAAQATPEPPAESIAAESVEPAAESIAAESVEPQPLPTVEPVLESAAPGSITPQPPAPVEPGPPLRPIAPIVPPPGLQVWSTPAEPGPFAQPYQAATTGMSPLVASMPAAAPSAPPMMAATPPPAPPPALAPLPSPLLPPPALLPPPPSVAKIPAAATRACPSCALPLSTKARFCRRCGAPQPA